MIVTLDEMKDFLRLEPTDTEENLLIESLILSADTYVKSATGFKFEDPLKIPETAKLIVKLLVSHWYENRGIETTLYAHKIGFTVDVLLSQLTYSHVEDEENA